MKGILKIRFNALKRKLIDGYLLRGFRFMPNGTLTIIVESTNICTLKCSCCPNGIAPRNHRSHGIMTKETFDIFLENLDVPVKSCYLHMCGEPFLNKNICYFAKKLLQRDIKPIIYSNGYKIDYNILDELLKMKGVSISFSMDLITKSHYESIRIPAKYETALKSIKEINSFFAKNNRYFGLNVIITDNVLQNLEDICVRLFEDYSNLIQIALSSMWPWPGYYKTGDIAGHVSKKGSLCSRIKELPVVLWNGDVSFCSFDYSGDLIIGNIKNQKISKIFNGRAARRIRRALLSRNFHKERLCNSCLLPRYESYSKIVYRNFQSKMNKEQRIHLFTDMKQYYERVEEGI